MNRIGLLAGAILSMWSLSAKSELMVGTFEWSAGDNWGVPSFPPYIFGTANFTYDTLTGEGTIYNFHTILRDPDDAGSYGFTVEAVEPSTGDRYPYHPKSAKDLVNFSTRRPKRGVPDFHIEWILHDRTLGSDDEYDYISFSGMVSFSYWGEAYSWGAAYSFGLPEMNPPSSSGEVWHFKAGSRGKR